MKESIDPQKIHTPEYADVTPEKVERANEAKRKIGELATEMIDRYRTPLEELSKTDPALAEDMRRVDKMYYEAREEDVLRDTVKLGHHPATKPYTGGPRPGGFSRSYNTGKLFEGEYATTDRDGEIDEHRNGTVRYGIKFDDHPYSHQRSAHVTRYSTDGTELLRHSFTPENQAKAQELISKLNDKQVAREVDAENAKDVDDAKAALEYIYNKRAS